jgi:hypothetical protein
MTGMLVLECRNPENSCAGMCGLLQLTHMNIRKLNLSAAISFNANYSGQFLYEFQRAAYRFEKSFFFETA